VFFHHDYGLLLQVETGTKDSFFQFKFVSNGAYTSLVFYGFASYVRAHTQNLILYHLGYLDSVNSIITSKVLPNVFQMIQFKV